MQYKNADFKEVLHNLKKEEKKQLKKVYSVVQKKSTVVLIQHQVNTAAMLASLGFDAIVLEAALAHELSEKQELKKLNPEAKQIVREIAKLKKVKAKNIKRLNEKDLAKVLLSIARDMRSIIIELASELDKLRFIQRHSEPESTAQTALNIYAPICHKLGLYEIEWELQDLAFNYLNPAEYAKIKVFIGMSREERLEKLSNAAKEIKKLLEKEGIQARIQTRAKNFYSIYKKTGAERKAMENLQDLLGIRIICENVEACYKTLNALHLAFQPTGKFYDYIAKPKENRYSSIHTAVIIKNTGVEVQIRTWEMHRDAEEGLAAHWKYKQFEQDAEFDKMLSLAKQLVQLQREEHAGFLGQIKLLKPKETVFAITPKNNIAVLPKNSTALDFAYAIHTDIGNKCKHAIVNGTAKPLSQVLENGDVVEIVTDKKNRVNRSWLAFVRSSKAKNKIRKELGLIGKPKKKVKLLKKKHYRRIIVAKCCNPIVGDDVVAYKTTKRKITIHKTECPVIGSLKSERKFLISDENWKKESYLAKIEVKAFDRPGLMIDLLKEIQKKQVGLQASDARTENENIVKCNFVLKVKHTKQAEEIIEHFLKVQNVLAAERV